MSVKPIPEGYHQITPYLTVQDGAGLIEFLQKAFGAEIVHRMDHANGDFWHADLKIGDSHVMVGGGVRGVAGAALADLLLCRGRRRELQAGARGRGHLRHGADWTCSTGIVRGE